MTPAVQTRLLCLNKLCTTMAAETACRRLHPAHVAATAVSRTGNSPSERVREPDHRAISLHWQIIGQFHGEYILCQSGERTGDHRPACRQRAGRLPAPEAAVRDQRDRIAATAFPRDGGAFFYRGRCCQTFSGRPARIGFELEPFGGNTIIISRRAAHGCRKDEYALVRDILAELASSGPVLLSGKTGRTAVPHRLPLGRARRSPAGQPADHRTAAQHGRNRLCRQLPPWPTGLACHHAGGTGEDLQADVKRYIKDCISHLLKAGRRLGNDGCVIGVNKSTIHLRIYLLVM